MAYHNPHLKITVVDRDESRIKQWKSKHLPLYEPGLYEILRVARDGWKSLSLANERGTSTFDNMSASFSTLRCEAEGTQMTERQPNLFFSTDISKCISEADMILIAVNTPTKKRGLGAGRATDMTALEAVTKQVAIHARPSAILVEKSTVPCRTVEFIQDTVT